MTTALIVFAKAPRPGLAKTRLIPALGPEGAAHLADRLLARAWQEGAAAGLDAAELCVSPDADDPAFANLAAPLTLQGDGDLGARMHRAFERVLAVHHAALLIGTDAPALNSARLREAAAALENTEAVFVPALDGGYALVGLRQPCEALFRDMRWSTSTVMAETRQRLQAAGMHWVELAAVHDIDEPADLVHVPPGWLT
jgi:uncharacterized protein